ncbi:DUF7660 family protein [Nonomuraea ferruginea]|uniref:DUF7660 domain-containing protein n=1 Tax=Nonomuraea ferruginea TaxID=46174 RepID=A0ABT4T665_9ACTN|nr:hypothetical protein [Nonomuraea ferruginea]MDA0644764.1 hypothetical protein [Nonomuraea ferruginea]
MWDEADGKIGRGGRADVGDDLSMASPQDADTVQSREDLVRYVKSLHQELINGADWENPTLDRYLEALAAWMDSSPGFYRNMGQPEPVDATWSFVAHALGAATIYE